MIDWGQSCAPSLENASIFRDSILSWDHQCYRLCFVSFPPIPLPSPPPKPQLCVSRRAFCLKDTCLDVEIASDFRFASTFGCLFLLPLFCIFFRIYWHVRIPCVCNLTIWLGVTDELLYQRHVLRQYYCNGTRSHYPSLHMDLGSANLWTVGSVGSVWFRVRINLGCISVCHPLLSHQDTTLNCSTILPSCKFVQLYQRHTSGRINRDSAWFLRLYFFVNLVFVCIWLFFVSFSLWTLSHQRLSSSIDPPSHHHHRFHPHTIHSHYMSGCSTVSYKPVLALGRAPIARAVVKLFCKCTSAVWGVAPKRKWIRNWVSLRYQR